MPRVVSLFAARQRRHHTGQPIASEPARSMRKGPQTAFEEIKPAAGAPFSEFPEPDFARVWARTLRKARNQSNGTRL